LTAGASEEFILTVGASETRTLTAVWRALLTSVLSAGANANPYFNSRCEEGLAPYDLSCCVAPSVEWQSLLLVPHEEGGKVEWQSLLLVPHEEGGKSTVPPHIPHAVSMVARGCWLL
jgi:hypothetical protein